MINISDIDKLEAIFYRSAYDFCTGIIARNKMEVNDAILETVKIMGSQVTNPEKLRDYLFEQISMEYERESFLVGEEVKNIVWWQEYRRNNKLQFWDRYYNYLIQKGWDRGAIDKSIDDTTDKILNALANPIQSTIEERRGMVVGYVQSGKTAHYIGLINKAIDAGYKIIIVLAGMHNNLRSQTQSRIDEEILGFETSTKYLANPEEQIKNEIGVGLGQRFKTSFNIQTMTSRDENGDFSKSKCGIKLDFHNPTILVVKKQESVLTNLIENFASNPIARLNVEKNVKCITPEYPMLIIDDEADQASINTNYVFEENEVVKTEYDPSTINKLIRSLFTSFECRSYVGYTATPYANIFIPDNAYHQRYGNDLFPKDFILSLPKPNRYIGAIEFFGSEDEPSMPLQREIVSNSFIDQKSKTVKDELPSELKTAIKSFLISIATRNCRGAKDKPNTMLIHVTRITDIQRKVHKKVEAYVDNLRYQIKGGDIEVIKELGEIWEKDYLPTTLNMKTNHTRHMDLGKVDSWENVLGEIKNIACDNLVKTISINGKSKEALLYKDHKSKQYNVIAIGGDKLSRGLTLEGLTVSYFTRESKMYDTLMQMGRWFGFRPGYADLCRLFVPKELYVSFKQISFATEDLRDQIDYMNNIEETPEKFGLRVATHPGLKISSEKKIKSGDDRFLSFSNTLSQTRSIDVDAKKYNKNFQATEKLIMSLGAPAVDYWERKGRGNSTNKHLFWENINGNFVANFLSDFETSKNANKANSMYMSEYILKQMKAGGLINWTICLINVGNEKDLKIANFDVGRGITREEPDGFDRVGDVCSVRTLTSKDHEYLDFTKEQMDEVKRIQEESKKEKEKNKSKTTAEYIRYKVRERENGLLILYPIDTDSVYKLKIEGDGVKTPVGFAIVFPDNKGLGKMVSYKLNAVGVRGEESELF